MAYVFGKERGIFSEPIDFDMMMINAYPDFYNISDAERVDPDNNSIKSVSGSKALKIPRSFPKTYANSLMHIVNDLKVIVNLLRTLMH